MSEPYVPQPGDLGFTKISGPAGWLTSFGQWFIGDPLRYDHVFVVDDVSADGEATIYEAMPEGAHQAPLDRKYEPNSSVMFVRFPLTEEQRAAIPGVVDEMVTEGVKYSFTSYLLLGLLRLGVKPDKLISYIENSKRLICSQLADTVLNKAGYHVFTDGRVEQDVSPADLVYAGIDQGEVWMVETDAEGNLIL